MSGKEKKHQQHDPIHYLRTVRGEDERSLNDMRRMDSDDEGCSYNYALEKSYEEDSTPNLIASSHLTGAVLNSGTGKSSDESIDSVVRAEPDSGASSAEQTTSELPEVRKAYRRQSDVLAPPARERPDANEAWPYRETLSFTRSLVFYGAGSITPEHERACSHIQAARKLRQTYFQGKGTVMAHPELLEDRPNLSYRMGKEGVAEIFHSGSTTNLVQVPTVERFQSDYHDLVEMTSEGAMRSFCFQRLQILSTSFKMHTTLNSTVEMEEQSSLLGTDFYRTMKVDNHIHAAAAPSAKQFVQFVRDKLETEPGTIVSTVKVKSMNDIGEEEVVGAVLAAEDPAAEIERIVRANVLEADRTPAELRLFFGLLARQANVFFGHGSLRSGRIITVDGLDRPVERLPRLR